MTSIQPKLANPAAADAIADLLGLEGDARGALAAQLGGTVEALIVSGGDDAVLGCALFSPVPDPLSGGTGLFLSSVVVDPEHRGRGVGKALMAALARLCLERELSRIDWVVDRLDLDARTFFDLLAPDSFQLNRLVYGVTANPLAALAQRDN